MAKVKNEHYITIQEFMVNDLELSGNELIAYALIYGFSQDGESYFKGSLSYVAKWLNCSKATACTILNKLAEDGFLEKKEKNVNGVRLCDYTAYTIDEKVLKEIKEKKKERKEKEKAERYAKKLNTTSKNHKGYSKNLNGRSKNLNGGIQKTLTHNTTDILDDTKDENINDNLDINALEDVKRPSSKGSMYASVPEEHKDASPKKQSRYIPPDYTEEQLIEHIRPTIEENLKTIQEDCGMEYNPKRADDIIEIVTDFFEQYREKTGHRHKILPDATLINIMYQYFNPPECLWDSNDPTTYSAMIEKYLDANFNARGGYDGEITLSISHFMSDKIRENCYHRSK